jgi:hypothetical protein
MSTELVVLKTEFKLSHAQNIKFDDDGMHPIGEERYSHAFKIIVDFNNRTVRPKHEDFTFFNIQLGPGWSLYSQ